MGEQQHSGFGQFIPGFDFLQNLAKGASASMPLMPNLSSWIAPTLNVEELDKRIGELKAVQFWLEQNKTALAATIQALEVQKMTLATLKGMNFNMADVAAAMKVKPAAPQAAGGKGRNTKSAQGKSAAAHDGAANVVDPVQWWGALTQQFQQIAANAMQEVAASTEAAKTAGQGASRTAAQAAGSGATPASARPKRPARKAAAG